MADPVVSATDSAASGSTAPSTEPIAHRDQWPWAIPVVMAIGVLALIIYSAALGSWSVFGYGFAVSGAAILAGGLLGFIFGIPITSTGGANNATDDGPYKDNSSLEQISDWLTKILVGVGLVQLGHATDGLSRLGAAMKPGFGDVKSSAGFGLAIVIFYAGTGFLYLYLWSRTDFLQELRALRSTVVKIASATATQVAESASQEKVDSNQSELQNVLSLVDKALYPNSGTDTPSQQELDAAMATASPYARQQSFQAAENQRRHYWKTNKPVMELTIPVFRALAASDTENHFHRNHGELGFALKDSAPPNWQEALDELTKAIDIRGVPASQQGWAVYEASRAECRINLDARFLAGKASTADVAAAIVADLAVAATDSFAQRFLGKADIKAWLTLNPAVPGVDPGWVTAPPFD